MILPQLKPHPLKREVRAAGLRLWQVKELCGGKVSESQLSRMLSGIIPMKKEVEARLTEVVKRLGD